MILWARAVPRRAESMLHTEFKLPVVLRFRPLEGGRGSGSESGWYVSGVPTIS